MYEAESGVYEGKAHSRALDFNKGVLLIAGSKGYYRYCDQRIYFPYLDTVGQLNGFEDIRDVEILDDYSIFYMNSGDNGTILRKDPLSGKYDTVFFQPGVFLDGMDFWEDKEKGGLAFGDPIDGQFFILKISSNGKIVNVIDNLPQAQDGEAGFAASGTSIQVVKGTGTAYIGTGGCQHPRLYYTKDFGETWSFYETPMKGGKSNGIYSLYFWSENEGVIIGGSYIDSTDNERMCFYTDDGGITWDERNKGLPGYCSSIQGNADGSTLFATGRSGTFYSTNKGKRWWILTEKTYYSIKVTKEEVFFSGKAGKWAVWRLGNGPRLGAGGVITP